MAELHVTVAQKIATYKQRDGDIVCGNSDYKIKFTFDEEWDAYEEKTARFIWNGQFQDVDFTGDTCDVPVINGALLVEVGVYAGELKTTTSATIGCQKSILCQGATPSVENDGSYANEAKEAADRAEAAADRAETAADRAEAAADFNPYGSRGLVFGVEIDNAADTTKCTRIASASGMRTNYAIGDTMAGDHENDFDSAFPWCAIRRCNIREDGSIVYEGEEGFALDGETVAPANVYEDGACTVLEASVPYSDGTMASSTATRTVVIPCKPNTTYAVSLPTGSYNRFQTAETTKTPAVGVAVQNRTAWTYAEEHYTVLNGRTYCVATTMADTKYLCVYYYISTYDTVDESEIRAKLMVTEGGEILPFTEYSTVSTGDVFVEIPKFYSLREVEGSKERICISGEKKSGFVCEPAFIDAQGNELEYIYVAAYNTGTDGASATGRMPYVKRRINRFREDAAAKGFSTFDFATLMAIQKLVLIELADRDVSSYYNGFGYLPYYQGATALESAAATNTVTVEGNFNVQHFRVGQWIAVWTKQSDTDERTLADRQITALGELTEDDSTPNRPYRLTITFDGDPVDVTAGVTQVYCTGQPSGLSDGLTYHTGTAGENGYSACRYRYMENLWGNVWEQCEGLIVKDLAYYYTLDPDLYGESTDAWERVGYASVEQNHYPGIDTAPSYIKSMGYDKKKRLIALPDALETDPVHYGDKLYTIGTTSPDGYEYEAGCEFVCVTGGGWDHLDRNGIYAMRFWSERVTESAYNWLYGSRMVLRRDIGLGFDLGAPDPVEEIKAYVDELIGGIENGTY